MGRYGAALHLQLVELWRKHVRYDLTVNTRSEQPRFLDPERRNFHRGYGPGLSEDGRAVHSGRRRNQWVIRKPSHSGQRV